MGKTLFIRNLKAAPPSGQFTIQLLVFDRSSALTSKGSTFLNLSLADRTGRIDAKVWDDTEALLPVLAPGRVCEAAARMDFYKGKPQLIVTGAAALAEGTFDPADFVTLPPRPLADMRRDLLGLAASIGDPDLRALVEAVLEHPEASGFWMAPAAKTIHHACPGGLLDHSLSVALSADLMAGRYPGLLNRDLLLAGAILHDLGKCWEFREGLVPEYTTIGRLMGHLVIGAQFVGKVAAGLPGFPSDKLSLLQHMLLAHHGDRDKGSPVTPKILEALVLHHLDDLDAKLAALGGSIREETAGAPMAWTGFNRLADGYMLSTPRWGDAPRDPGPPAGPSPPIAPSPPAAPRDTGPAPPPSRQGAPFSAGLPAAPLFPSHPAPADPGPPFPDSCPPHPGTPSHPATLPPAPQASPVRPVFPSRPAPAGPDAPFPAGYPAPHASPAPPAFPVRPDPADPGFPPETPQRVFLDPREPRAPKSAIGRTPRPLLPDEVELERVQAFFFPQEPGPPPDHLDSLSGHLGVRPAAGAPDDPGAPAGIGDGWAAPETGSTMAAGPGAAGTEPPDSPEPPEPPDSPGRSGPAPKGPASPKPKRPSLF
jgi:3'-5' exoribonuclease